MKRYQQSEVYSNAIKVAKRVAITILCCIPFLIIFGYLTRKVEILQKLQILIFTVVFALAVLIEEVVARKIEKRKQAEKLLGTKKDVFK